MQFSRKTWLLMALAACTPYLKAQATLPASPGGAGRSCQPFPSNTFYPENYLPVVLTGDVNGDGIPDLVTVNRDGVSVLIGKGDGTFNTGGTFPTGGDDFNGGAVAGDFNHDGKLDVAVATSPFQVGHPGAVNLLLGNGDGTFQSPRKSQIQISTTFLAAGDFNHDGNLDLAGVSQFSSTPIVQVLLGNGDGSFQSPVNFGVRQFPSEIAVADFNSDGKLDLAVANAGISSNPGHTVSVLLGNGDGTFKPELVSQVGREPFGIAAADLNGDGKVDLATANYLDGTTSVLLGNGDGTFGTSATYVTGHPYAPYRVAAVQFDAGGKAGLAVETLAGTFILVNKGNGAFLAAQGYNPAGAGGLAVADFNGDGKADLAMGAGEYDTGSAAAVLFGKGNGVFVTSTAYVAVPNAVSVALGDFNGDGIPDLAVGDLDSPYYLGIMLGNRKGGFSSTVNLYTVRNGATGIASGDLNGDGKLDLAVAVFGTAEVQVLLGNGDGSFTAGGSFKLAMGSPPTFGFIALADFNHDGVLDTAVTSPGLVGTSGVVSILLGNGDGTFQTATGYAVETGDGALQGIAIGDFNGDGKPDFAVADNTTGMLHVFLGKGDGTFRTGPQTSIAPNAATLAVGDFNGDGKLDVAVGGTTIQILLGKGDGSLRQGASLNTPGGGLTAADFNGDGRLDLASFLNTEMMEFLPGNGDGTFGQGVSTYISLGPSQFALGDLNGDGFPDLVSAGAAGGAVSVLLNRCGKQ